MAPSTEFRRRPPPHHHHILGESLEAGSLPSLSLDLFLSHSSGIKAESLLPDALSSPIHSLCVLCFL